jgi:hypothetical protein
MCGRLVGEPAVPHTREDCEICGRAAFTLPTDAGLDVKAGQSVVIPAGALQMSLDTEASSGQFTYDGISWFVRELVGNSAADTPDQMLYSLNLTKENADAIIKGSPLLAEFDLDSDDEADAVLERLKEHEGTVVWFAFLKGTFAALAERAIEEDDALRAAFGAQQSMLAHAAIVFERDLKDVVWHGYGKVGADQLGEALELWEQNEDNDDEEFWQQTITERPFLLEQLCGAPVVIQKGKAYVGGKGVSNTGGGVLDFLLRQEVMENVALLEIKTPTEALLRNASYRAGIYGPSEALGGSIVQVTTYRQSLLTDFNTIAKDELFEAFNPRCLLLVGNAKSELADKDRRKSFELFRRGLRDLDVVTYDELFARVRALRGVLAASQSGAAPESVEDEGEQD